MVELMIVLAIMGILLVTTIPAGTYWVGNARIASVEGSLNHAVGRAKSAAFRNQRVAADQEPVVAVCISASSTLSVLEGTVADTPDCATNIGTQLWSASLDARVSITNNGNAVTCMCFNNLGMLTTNSCAGCMSQSTLSLATSDFDETVYIY